MTCSHELDYLPFVANSIKCPNNRKLVSSHLPINEIIYMTRDRCSTPVLGDHGTTLHLSNLSIRDQRLHFLRHRGKTALEAHNVPHAVFSHEIR